MPIYEYLCEKCGGRFEVIQKFADEPVAVHEVCGGGVHRLLSAPALKFKGSGFYINDYAKGSGSGGGQAGKDTGKDSGSKDKSGQNGGAETSKSDSGGSPSKTDNSPAPATPAASSSDKK